MKTPRPDRRLLGAVLFWTGAIALASVGGCEKPKPPPPAPPAPKRAEAPPPPEPVRTDALLQTMKADARVQFPQASAPGNEALARAVIGFADALARGDAEKFKSMLDPGGKAVLDKLVASGQWDESTGTAIEAVRVAKLTSSGGGGVVMLAIQEPRGAYPLAWAVTTAAGAAVFTALPVPNVVRTRASEFDSLAITPGADSAPGGASTDAGPAGAPAPDAAPGAAPAPAPAQPAAAPDDGSKTRSTPNGKVKIPGAGRPSGG